MALAVGAECRVAGVKHDGGAVVAVFTLALEDAVILSVALVDVPAALRAGVERYKGKDAALAVKLLGRFDYVLKMRLSAAAEQVFNGLCSSFRMIISHFSFRLQ